MSEESRPQYGMRFFEDGMNVAASLHPSSCLNILALMTFRKPVSREAILTCLRAKLFHFERFRSLVRKNKRGRYVFEDLGLRRCMEDGFLEKMTTEKKLQGGDEELQRYQTGIMHKPFDPELPQWEMHLLQQYKLADGCVGTALVFRINHCLGDGVTLIQVLLSLTEEDGANAGQARTMVAHDGTRVQSMDGGSATNDPSFEGGGAQSLLGRLQASLPALASWLHTIILLPFSIPFVAISTELRDTATVLQWQRAKHQPCTSKMTGWTKEFSLQKLKVVSKGLGATLNDVLMSAVGGWTRRYLTHKNAGGAASCDRGPRIRANMAVSLVPKRLSDPIRFGVNVSFVQVQVPVKERDLASRVAAVKRSISWLKAIAAPWIAYYLQWVLFVLGGQKPLQTKLAQAADKTHMTVSNVVGPRDKVALCGETVQRLLFFVNPCNLGVMVCIVSYGGCVSVSTLLDPQVVEDQGLFMKCVEEELEDISAAAG